VKEHTPGQNIFGAYFTPKPLAQWISSMALELHQRDPPPNKSTLYVVDPAAGDGVFLRSLGKILAQQESIQVNSAKMKLIGWELQKEIAEKASSSLQQWIHTEKSLEAPQISFMMNQGDGLLHLLQSPDHYDLILGNPPYLRQETLTPDEKERLLNLLQETIPTLPKTFSKQADYYIYFIFAAIRSLTPGGVLGFLISTSWMNTKFGRGLREWILAEFKGKVIFAHTPGSRLYPEAKINCLVLFVQKPLRTEKTTQISIEVWKLHNDQSSSDILTISKQSISPEMLQQNVNWETVLFRCPPEYFPIYSQFSPFLLPLTHFAKVATGIYTGLNQFYYLPKHPDTNEKKRPDAQFLVPVIRTPKEISTWHIIPAELSTQMFVCREPEAALAQSYPKTHEYIRWGSTQKTKLKQKVVQAKLWPEVPSVHKRKPGWWALPPTHAPTTVFLRYIYYQNKLQPFSPTPIYSDRCFHQVYPHAQLPPHVVSLVLNFQITQLLIEILGRNTLGQGALKLETMTARQLPILDCFDLPFWSTWEKNQETAVTLTQLPAIEVKVYEQLGIPRPEKVYGEICRIHQTLVEKRVNKARSL
jgi:hypothetical protein